MKWMLRQDAPLLLNPRPSVHKYSWLGEFTGQIRNYRANTIATTRLAIEARKHLFSIAEEEGIDFDVKHRGILHIYRDKAGFDAAARVNALLREGGLDRRPVTPGEMRRIEPTLHGSYYGGFFTPSDSTGDIHKYTRGLAEACRRRHRIVIEFLRAAGVSEATALRDAEGIEHHVSRETLAAFERVIAARDRSS